MTDLVERLEAEIERLRADKADLVQASLDKTVEIERLNKCIDGWSEFASSIAREKEALEADDG